MDLRMMVLLGVAVGLAWTVAAGFAVYRLLEKRRAGKHGTLRGVVNKPRPDLTPEYQTAE